MDFVTKQLIKMSGRSWWQCDYENGDTLSEWDTLLGKVYKPIGGIKNDKGRWEEIKKEGMIRLRIICPNGQYGQLENTEGRRFFQLKTGGFTMGRGQYCDAHIIGVVINDAGDCNCWAWEYPKFETNERLVSGVVAEEYRKDKSKYFKLEITDAGMKNTNCYVKITTQTRPNQLTGFTDNIFNMKYEHLGALSLDVQRLKV